VLFADISGSSRLYHELGDAQALRRVRQCLRLMEQVVGERGGRVIKQIGDGLMCDFVEPDQALNAAREMLTAVTQEEAERRPRIGVHVGCHFGPVIENAGDLFGSTVNIASSVSAVARTGQIITTRETVARLSEPVQLNVRLLSGINVKSLPGEITLYEFLWQQQSRDLTVLAAPAAQSRGARLTLASPAGEVVLEPSNPRDLTLGRLETCDIRVEDVQASRQHATIKARGDRFILVDHSSNGTYLAWTDGGETCVKRAETILPARGKLALGSSTQEASATVVEFTCES